MTRRTAGPWAGFLSWLRGRRAAAPDDAPAAAAAAAAASALGRLGPYRLERELGRGAMGAVYLACDTRSGKAAAIKTMALAREFAGADLAEARERFFREAATAGRLRHPDIVSVLDAGEDRDLAYLAMEFIPGQSLQAHTLPGRLLPVPEVLHVGARIARALAFAHRQGVVHRDVKPANVLVERGAGIVKVADFGVARLGDAAHTRTGMVLGTPSYMAPEQLAGQRVSARADLYSLGATLFQLLTGALPHASESMAALMHDIVNRSAPDVRSLRPGLPAALADVIALALQKRPEVRYADGDALADDLLAVAAALVPPGVSEATEAGAFVAPARLPAADPRHNSRH